MKNLGSVYVDGIVPKIRYKGGLTINLDPGYGEDENDPEKKTYVYFFGIPYAKPPVKKRRFEPPEQYERGLVKKYLPYDATKARPDYRAQPGTENRRLFIGSEDCLYLNIYLPKEPMYITSPLPVLVYFHGGGFYSGTGNYKHTTPDSIIKENIIFVTVNYRLGPFGFLNMHAEQCKGNAGLKDQVMALRWIQENIEAFRGDPGNVTICGGGTGGTCVNFHLISPLSKGLFHKAIVQSGGIYCPWGFKGHQRAIMKHFNDYRDLEYASRDKILRGLKSLGTRSLVKLNRKIRGRESNHPQRMEIHLGPSFESFPENAFLPPSDTIEELMEKTEPAIPILAGITAKEGYCINCKHVGHIDMDWVKHRDKFTRFLCANRFKKEAAIAKCDLIRTAYFQFFKDQHEFVLREKLANFYTDLWFHRFYDNFKFGPREDDPEERLDHVQCVLRRHEDRNDPEDEEEEKEADPAGPLYVYSKDQNDPEDEEEEKEADPAGPLDVYSKDRNDPEDEEEEKEADPAGSLYVYSFNFRSEINPTRAFREEIEAAGHGDDIAYLFPTRAVRKTFQLSLEVRKTIKTMCSLWASFCRTGKPTCPLYPDVQWTRHTKKKPRHLVIDKEIKLEKNFLFKDSWNFLEDLVPTPTTTTPTTPACSTATEEDWILALSKDFRRPTYEYCCDMMEIPKLRKRSHQSKSSTSTSDAERSQSTQLSPISEEGSGTSAGLSVIQESSSGNRSESGRLSSPDEPLPSTSSGIFRPLKKLFFPLKKK